ncbi:intermembrane transport protein PqiB [Psychrobium sp. nBUS_13]|uniref:intermembrane transport protein PqiB n=1 Tax=Psychrobium sp. nBUS_13 TaxID=3395319 RepID=UPI003EBCCF19
MSEAQVPQPMMAEIKTHNRISKVWLIPFLALAIASWMVIDTYVNRGPAITITFETAEGLVAGKTRVKTLEVDIGFVKDVRLQGNGVIAHIQLDQQVADMLTEDANFWVVKPRIGSGGISGLGTLMSGSYIEFVPGNSSVLSTTYTGLEQEPITGFGVPGTRLDLVSEQGNSLSIGEPVLYRGFEVGRVEKSTFDIENRRVHYQIFVKSPYSELLTENTYFWNSSGVDFNATTQGIKVNVGSLESIISGGVTFDVPIDLPLGNAINTARPHVLYPDADSVYERRQYQAKEFIVMFEDSIRGLDVGAPVEYRGIRVGTVAKIDSTLTMDILASNEQRIPVLIKFEPARLGLPDEQTSVDLISQYIDKWTEQGLRATLKSGSLLTGSLFVDLDYYTLDSQHQVETYQSWPVMPSMAGSLAQIEEKVFDILDKFSSMPIEVTVDNINQMLASANSTMIGLNEAIADVKALINAQETQAIPESVNKTLSQLSKTLESYNHQAPVYGELEQSLSQFQQLMRDIQPLIKELNNKPNALIFKGQVDEDPQPKGK